MKNKDKLSTNVRVIDFTTYLLMLSKVLLGETVKETQYNINYPSTDYSLNENLTTVDEKPIAYSRECYHIIPFSEEGLRRQFLHGIKVEERGVLEISRNVASEDSPAPISMSFKDAFDIAKEQAVLDVVENYSSEIVCIKLNKTDYVIASLDENDIDLLKTGDWYGVLRVYAPRKFRMFRVIK